MLKLSDFIVTEKNLIKINSKNKKFIYILIYLINSLIFYLIRLTYSQWFIIFFIYNIILINLVLVILTGVFNIFTSPF